VKSLHLGKRVSEATKSVLKSQFKSIGQMMELNFDNFFQVKMVKQDSSFDNGFQFLMNFLTYNYKLLK